MSEDHKTFESGLKKEVSDKPRFDLIPHELLERVARRFQHGMEKYGKDNWRLGNTDEEIDIFKQSSFRHLIQWENGLDFDEDHAAALITDVMMWEWLAHHKARPKQ